MKSRFGLKVLGLCALVIGVMGISSSSALALEPEWMVNGADVGMLEPSVGASLENNVGRLLSKLNGLAIEVTCTAAKFVNVKLLLNGLTTSGKVVFEGCKVFELVPSLKELPCTVKSAGAALETIETKEGTGKLELHVKIVEDAGGVKLEIKTPVTLVIPNVGEEFANLRFEGASCPLTTIVPVVGKLALKDCEEGTAGKGGETEQVTHLVEEFPALTELYLINKINMERLATLDGSGNVVLTGAHESKVGKEFKFSGLAR